MLVLLHCGIFVVPPSSLHCRQEIIFDTLLYLMFFAQERLSNQMIQMFQYKSHKYLHCIIKITHEMKNSFEPCIPELPCERPESACTLLEG